jgi:sugar (pentulose or hexulose) kinase
VASSPSAGGGAQSDLWCQVMADVCDRTVERVADHLLAGLHGSAMSAALAFGVTAYDEVRGARPRQPQEVTRVAGQLSLTSSATSRRTTLPIWLTGSASTATNRLGTL